MWREISQYCAGGREQIDGTHTSTSRNLVSCTWKVVDVYDMCMYFAGKCVWHDRIQVGKTVININRVEVVQIFILQV